MTYETFSIRASNLKCFDEEPQGFDSIKWINLIVGRNNVGKSTLLDLIQYSTQPSFDVPLSSWHLGKEPSAYSETTFEERDVNAFPDNTAGGSIDGSHRAFGSQFVGARVKVRLIGPKNSQFISVTPPNGKELRPPPLGKLTDYSLAVANAEWRNPLRGKQLFRLAPERDIRAEPDASGADISANGAGATTVIQQFINKSHLPGELVQVKLLGALNAVVEPDSKFTEIVCRQHSNSAWEIFLTEETKGRIALSQSGSGLKTVILALCFVHLIPPLRENRPLRDFIFAFEEPENNLHPALQRRLLSYLAERAVENQFPLFVTTHSSVAIDMFSKDANAQILHVTHDGVKARCRTITTYVENRGVLDDLDVRASDLLQSNGIIWLEGPSDRIYVNRWISLWSDGVLSEGKHYQCVFYGGRLLAHLSAEEPAARNEGISILRVNRNAVVLIDSDKRTADAPINQTKQRIVSEIEMVGGMSWVTAGREIENYVSPSVVAEWLGIDVLAESQRDPHESFFDYLDHLRTNKGKEFREEKPLLAEQLVPYMTRERLAEVLDLSERLDRLCGEIRKWNNLPAPLAPGSR